MFIPGAVLETTPHPAVLIMAALPRLAPERSDTLDTEADVTWRLKQVQYLPSLEYSVTVLPTYALSVIWIWALDKDDQYVRVWTVWTSCFCIYLLFLQIVEMFEMPQRAIVSPRYVLRYFPEDSGSI